MQALIAIPEFASVIDKQKAAELLMHPVAGVPLLKRIVLTASRAGATDVLLICPEAQGHAVPQEFLREVSQGGSKIRVIKLDKFNPKDPSGWATLHLNDEFIWVPWNWVTTKQFLKNLPLLTMTSVDWAKPAHISLHDVVHNDSTSTLPISQADGIRVTSADVTESAERFLVAHSGKVLDGIHTSFNRRLCRPFVRLLSHTSVTPNAVTFGGVIVSIVSAVAFGHGGYLYSVLGALLFYIAGLFDEMDGMLARIKFAESPRGTWLEGFADGLSYLLLFGGITIGLNHRYGRPAILMGILLLVGAALALVTTSLQRRRATTADRPNEYLGNMYQLLDKDSGNWISRMVRQLQAFVRRGILVHYIFIFTLIGALPLIFVLATLGAHLTWILTLYFNRRFFAQSFNTRATPTASTIKEAL
ncbi:CDP-alcohol phosphatidyltransferase family protein [Edaphobacter sp. HDX4]|uniref:CDP-alcohol phosphatidyltransferase family protein n=1 Tax=Edaphobacter sp. HDX4 TaxID=2794064 RepID=UPI002FE65446